MRIASQKHYTNLIFYVFWLFACKSLTAAARLLRYVHIMQIQFMGFRKTLHIHIHLVHA